jgi:DNA-binding NarL/FixJ family response regulator
VSKAGIAARPTVAGEPARERIGLIAGEATCEVTAEILAILAREGLAVTFFDSVQAILEMDGSAQPSAIVLWLRDTISSVPRSIKPLCRRFEQVPVVLACASIQRWEVRAALAAGVAGVVVHKDLETSLGPCLQAVRAGHVCVPKAHSRQIAPAVLSARERQVLGLAAVGYMNSQIAERLFLAPSTVKGHLSSAFGKLGVRSRNEAADLIRDPQHGVDMGILGLDDEAQEIASLMAR